MLTNIDGDNVIVNGTCFIPVYNNKTIKAKKK